MADNSDTPKNANEAPEPAEERPSFNLRADVPAEIRNVSFPMSVRGYDRTAVDAYIHRVNRVIAELEVSRSPQAAVRHAVDRVSEQTKGILQQARESAEQITGAAREEAEQIIAAAKAEAADLVVNASTEADRLGAEAEQALANARAEAEEIVARANAEGAEQLRRSQQEIAALQAEAEARMRDLQTDTDAVWRQRGELLGEIDQMATRLQEAAAAAAARFSPEVTATASEEQPAEEPSEDLQAQPTLVAAPEDSEQEPSEAVAGRGGAGSASQRRKR
jgi:DivIVA domain-containing protein